jgi:hypothetical protein
LSVPSVAVPDTDYLHFGWWTKVDKDGDVAFRTFSGGIAADGNAFDSNNIAALVGTATYKGPAAGRYAVKTFNSNATIDSIRHGVFTAAATLTAKFGGDDIAVSKQDRISGEITGFESKNDDNLDAWSVTLKAALLRGRRGDEVGLGLVDGVFTGIGVAGALGGSPVNNGDWNGQFFDDGADDDPHPNSVAGEFNARSSHGAVAGAFGAEKDD